MPNELRPDPDEPGTPQQPTPTKTGEKYPGDLSIDPQYIRDDPLSDEIEEDPPALDPPA